VSRAAAADPVLPDVAVTLVLHVHDTAGWLLLHDRALAAPRDSPKSLEVTTLSGPRGRRSIVILGAKFDSTLVRPGGFFRVIVTGRMTGTEALATVSLFQQAVLERKVGPAEHDLMLFYGLTSVGAHLVELKVKRT
jgi:hypothetical protein